MCDASKVLAAGHGFNELNLPTDNTAPRAATAQAGELLPARPNIATVPEGITVPEDDLNFLVKKLQELWAHDELKLDARFPTTLSHKAVIYTPQRRNARLLRARTSYQLAYTVRRDLHPRRD